MPIEMLTYADLGERLKISPEAARALVKRHRLPRSRSNDGKTLVQVDLSEINHSPVPRASQAPGGHQAVAGLKQRIEALQAELAEMEMVARGHRADFERECERTNKLLAELLKSSVETLAAREKAARCDFRVTDQAGRCTPRDSRPQPLPPTSFAKVSRNPMVRFNTSLSGVESLSRTK